MNVLEKIVLDKRIEVKQREIELPLAHFVDQLVPSDRDFKQALIDDRYNKGAAFILECKKASPSKGLIRDVFDLDEICDAYGQFASCVSILTDEKYFQGEFERLPIIRSKLSQPVLCKDFFVAPYQVYLARHFGANAILLMLSVLNDEEYVELDAIAKQYGLAVLTEVSNQQEMERAVNLNCEILGINNRNLRDLSTDLNQTPKLVEMFKALTSKEQQENTVLISESGIYSHDQVKKLNDYVQGYLVGSSLMAQKDLSKACQDLTLGQHKVCGITQSKDAIAVAKAGAAFAGLIFVPKSKRYVKPAHATKIIESTLKSVTIPFVAVVQDLSVDQVIDLIEKVPVSAIQLHGNEDQVYVDELKSRLHVLNKPLDIWQVLSISEDGTLPKQWPKCDKILLDTITKSGQKGGSGIAFDWRNLADLPLDLPPIILAGGINIENIEHTLTLPIIGVDLNSGVESQPGIKDHELIKQCFDKLLNRTALKVK